MLSRGKSFCEWFIRFQIAIHNYLYNDNYTYERYLIDKAHRDQLEAEEDRRIAMAKAGLDPNEMDQSPAMSSEAQAAPADSNLAGVMS
ncbi:hypothetical protein [Rhodoligotrophos defluvii]|uniref:hypothetical protein n=1 Tax=Rhodoligotrophos defluvii TaxID=2561934 RepID=UPI0010C9DE2D|nr:hypothetical protein [Rhodoligotrophos defluvii]